MTLVSAPSARRLALLGLCVASTTACSPMPNRDIMFTQLAATAEPSKLHATIVQYNVSEEGAWADVGILRSAAVTVDLDTVTLALGHLVSGDPGDVGLKAVAVTPSYAFSRDVATGVATITASRSATVVATFDTPGSAVAWFVSEALGLAYVVHERPSDSEQRVLMAPLGCGASCVVRDTQLGGGSSYVDSTGSVLVDDAAQVVRLPLPCCMCVSHASYRFDEAGMHRRGALDTAFASFAVDTRGALVHVAGQHWDTAAYPGAARQTFTAATIASSGFGASTNVSTLTFPAAALLALLDRAHTPVAPPTPPPPPPSPSTLPPPPPYNCLTKELWSAAKSRWCCDNKQLGCPKCGGTATPLEGSNCGRLGTPCGDGYYCDVEPTDAWAVCCPQPPPPPRYPPFPPLASLESVVLTMSARGRAAWSSPVGTVPGVRSRVDPAPPQGAGSGRLGTPSVAGYHPSSAPPGREAGPPPRLLERAAPHTAAPHTAATHFAAPHIADSSLCLRTLRQRRRLPQHLEPAAPRRRRCRGLAIAGLDPRHRRQRDHHRHHRRAAVRHRRHAARLARQPPRHRHRRLRRTRRRGRERP